MSVPQIRIAAIEAIARKILMEYDPALLEGEPCAIPIETIIETKFDLILEYHILRKNGSILGETIFDDGAVILYDQYQHEYRLIGVKAGTILIDERLCEPQRLGRLRFTCGHELAHWVLHKKLYTELVMWPPMMGILLRMKVTVSLSVRPTLWLLHYLCPCRR